MNTPYQPYSLDTTHLVPVSRIGNRPITPSTLTTRTRSRTTVTPRIVDATALPTRTQLLADLHRSPDERATAQLWAYRAWITVKALALATAVAAITALVALTVFAIVTLIGLIVTAVTWVIHHLVAIAVVIGLLFLLCGGKAACTGIHCGGCKG